MDRAHLCRPRFGLVARACLAQPGARSGCSGGVTSRCGCGVLTRYFPSRVRTRRIPVSHSLETRWLPARAAAGFGSGPVAAVGGRDCRYTRLSLALATGLYVVARRRLVHLRRLPLAG